jgi:hypothetical protein
MSKDDPYLTLLDDLQAYDNPEAFTDTGSDGVYRLSLPFPDSLDEGLDLPVVAALEIQGDKLMIALREYLFWTFTKAPVDFEKAGVKTIQEFKELLLADPVFGQAEKAYFWFFVRHFPELVNKLMITLGVLAIDSLATHGGFISEEQRKKEEVKLRATVEVAVKGYRNDLKRILRTRTRGGKTPTIAPDIRASLHLEYQQLYKAAKLIKKHHDSLYQTYIAQHHRTTQDVWTGFWLDHAAKVFSDQPKEFLALFAEIDRPSASEASYIWLARSHRRKLSYIKKLVKESKKVLSNSSNESTSPSD